jgi:uncharacterized protein YqgC (DUF456 family)
MSVALVIVAIILVITGIVGCIVPALPGVPLSYLALVLLRFSDKGDKVSNTLLIVYGVLTAVVTVLDYVIPAWGTKRFGGSKWGVWGSTIGLLVGLFMGPLGIVIGPFVGAVVFELLGGKPSREAIRAGWGTFVGLLSGTIIKLIICGLIAYHVITILV